MKYFKDSQGNTTGVYIPAEEWKVISSDFLGEDLTDEIPEFHKPILKQRLEELDRDGAAGTGLEAAMLSLKKKYGF